MLTTSTLFKWSRTAAVIGGLTLFAGGCAMPDSSNPTLSLTGASVSGSDASLQMRIENPSDMDVRVKDIDWTLVYGPLPVADGSWQFGTTVPSKGSYNFSRRVRFDTPPMDRGAEEIEFSGTMNLETVGNSGNMALESASFTQSRKVR